jgi:histidyl-tRNA synthetase
MTDKQPLSTEPYKGVHDYYPEDWRRMMSVFDTVRKTLRMHGFEEYQASPLERAEIYESKTSEEIVSQQTYTFTDRGDRRVTLRPEMTPTLARMIAGKRRELVFPVRWFSIGNRFRYERPQKGRSREFYQVDVDIAGIANAAAEGEAVVMAYEVLHALGATDTDFVIRINSRALINAAGAALGLTAEQTTDYLSLIDRKDKMPAEEFETARAAFRVGGHDPLELIEARTDETVDAEYQKIEELIASFRERGMDNVIFDPTIARGFLYYTGLIMEAFDTDPENPRALLGGGRYDGLVALFGGDPVPAVGFAIGIETLMDFLSTHDLLPKTMPSAHVLIGTPAESDIKPAQKLAKELRLQGLNVLVNISSKSLGDQVKEADKRGIPFFFAYGENEAKSGTMKLKELASGREDAVSEDELAAIIVKGYA